MSEGLVKYTYHMIRVNDAVVGGVAPMVERSVKAMPRDEFLNPEYYPPGGTSVESALRYFIFMVAIDHRTSRHKPFEAYVDSKLYHGADLLYRLGSRKFLEDPEFFSPDRMSSIRVNDVVEWLSVREGGDSASVWDPEVRTSLLRDLGLGLVKWFRGSVSELIKASRGYLRRGPSQGLTHIMRRFKAYSDPVEKKTFLFAKFAERRGLINIADPWNKEVPVDNHLTRIALRLHLISPEEALRLKMRAREHYTYAEDVALRLAVRTAYKELAKVAGVDPFILDDFLWYFGRKVCTRERPACVRAEECPLADVCLSRGSPEEITEHYYLNTYYY